MPRRTRKPRRRGTFTVPRNPAFKRKRGPMLPFAERMKQQLNEMQEQSERTE